jgi:hypothetical protein
MEKEFTSISRYELQQAFALAHRSSEDLSIPLIHRKRFRAIAQLIWKAHGEEQPRPPEGTGEKLLAEMKRTPMRLIVENQ